MIIQVNARYACSYYTEIVLWLFHYCNSHLYTAQKPLFQCNDFDAIVIDVLTIKRLGGVKLYSALFLEYLDSVCFR